MKDTKRSRTAQNNINRQRSKAMERSVARYFGGVRVPMSGSGGLKGDCIVPYDTYRNIYVECKHASSKKIRVQQAWLEKISRETKDMRCFLGMLVVHYLYTRCYLCLVPEECITRMAIDKQKRFVFSVQDQVHDLKSFVIDYTVLKRQKLPEWIQTQHGNWLMLEHVQMKRFLEQ